MNNLKEYIINFVGLKQGFHSFEFLINNTFFEEMQSEETMDVDISLHLELENKINLLVLNFKFSGSFNTLCDRCGDDISIPLHFSESLFFKISDESITDEDINVVCISTNDFQIDISPFVYELIMVNIPFKRVHENDKNGKSLCNEANLKFLEEEIKLEVDPRWEALKKLKIDS